MKEKYIVFYTKKNQVYIIPKNYSHSLMTIIDILDYADEISTLPNTLEAIHTHTLRGERYKGKICIEYISKTAPTEGELLEDNSPLLEWLVY